MTANKPTHAESEKPGVLADRKAERIKHLRDSQNESVIPDEGTICGDTQNPEKRDNQETLGINLDDTYEIISSERRRLLIFILAEFGREYNSAREPYIPVGNVAELIAEATPNEDTNRKAVYITLIQNHLSKLDEAGVINYDERAKEIQPEFGTYQLESILLSIEREIGKATSMGSDRCN